MTIEKVLQKEKYRNIIFLLYISTERNPVRQVHLIKKIVVPNKKSIKEEPPENIILKKIIKAETDVGYINLENKFKSKYGLRRALTRLKKLELAISYKPEGYTTTKYSHLKLTEKGRCAWLKYTIIRTLSEINDYQILYNIFDYAELKSLNAPITEWIFNEPE